MTINLSVPSDNPTPELKPRITVVGVGGAGGNAVNNMIQSGLQGVDFVVANTDAQALAQARTDRRIQLGTSLTGGLGAGSRPDVGRAAAEEVLDEVLDQLRNSNMVFVTAGMGGGTGTGAAPVIARAAKEHGVLTVGVVTKPFHFEGVHRMRIAEAGIEELQHYVDTLIIIPNQNLFRVANEKTTFADAFKMADDVLYLGVRGVTDLMVMPGLINLDFADIRAIMSEMGKAMMGTGEAEGERRAIEAAEKAISNPLLEDTSIKGARGVLINITGGMDLTLFEVDEAANLIRDQVDPEANIIFGSGFDDKLNGRLRVSVVATGIEAEAMAQPAPRLINVTTARAATVVPMRPEPIAAPVAQPTAPTAIKTAPAADRSEDLEPAEAAPAAIAPAAPTPAEKPMPAAPATLDAPFIPPAPVEVKPATAKAADPFKAAEVVNAVAVQARDKAPEKPTQPKERTPSLFERVTGSTRFGKPKAVETAAPAPAPVPAPAVAATRPAVAPAKPAAVPLPPKPAAAAPVAPKLGVIDPTDRLAPSQANEDDLLDIPAFLRRQAN
jgi:cell division protein FtsZ